MRRFLGATSTASSIQAMITAAAAQFGVNPQLALSVAQQESGFNQNAVSSAGAIGVMQLEPATAVQLGVNPNDVQQNISGGVQYLSQLISYYGGDVSKALAAYDWGEGNVNNAVAQQGSNWLSSAPAETQNYVSSILNASGVAYPVSSPASGVDTGSADLSAGDLTDTSDDSGDVVAAGPNWAILAMIAAAGLGAYFVLDSVLGD